jgi:hypothetical protein
MKDATKIQWNSFKWFSLSIIISAVIALLAHTFELVGDSGAVKLGLALGIPSALFFAIRFAKVTFFGRERFPDGK